MKKRTSPIVIPEEYISSINFNGLKGRKLVLPAPEGKDKELVFFYGHHSSLERVYAITQFLNKFGKVTAYDFPGFGGMDGFQKIDLKPTIDNYADYMYTVLKTHKSERKLIVVGMSMAFAMLTRMSQRHPRLTDRIDVMVSFVGFGHYRDFKFFPKWGKFFIVLWRFCSLRPVTAAIKLLIFNPLSLRLMMGLFLRFNPKLKSAKGDEARRAVQMEMDLWRVNDLSTHFKTYNLMLTLDMTSKTKIPLHLYDMSTGDDQYFDPSSVEQTLNGLYRKVTTTSLNLEVHVPSIISTVEEVADIIPERVKQEVLYS